MPSHLLTELPLNQDSKVLGMVLIKRWFRAGMDALIVPKPSSIKTPSWKSTAFPVF